MPRSAEKILSDVYCAMRSKSLSVENKEASRLIAIAAISESIDAQVTPLERHRERTRADLVVLLLEEPEPR